MSSDKRIGGHFLYPGPGYGGSCFPKDVKALTHTAKEHGMELEIVDATERVNERQKMRVFEKVVAHFGPDLKGKTFAFWGVAFKANTDDIRETSAITLANKLSEAGAKVQFYDPEASNNFLSYMKQKHPETENSLSCFDDKYECLKGADALVTVTEWREFAVPDFTKIKELLKSAVIFDGRNLYNTQKVLDLGFKYYAIGKFIS